MSYYASVSDFKLKEILADLIRIPSVTPYDEGCQAYMMRFLQDLGFRCNKFNCPPVANFYAEIGSKTGPLLMFAGHTDVVPAGNLDKWNTDPFTLHEKQGMLYGRGTADMKGSLACMLMAAQQFISQYKNYRGRLGFIITSAEEGDHFHLGTPHVMSALSSQDIVADYCIVGEPSSTSKLGDVVKIGRRGSLTGNVLLHGKQGHVAYPHLADNPIHNIGAVLCALTTNTWDTGNKYFPPTTLQITHIQSGGDAGNVIPGELKLQFNFRFSTENTAQKLKEMVYKCFARHDLNPTIEWRLNGEPFITEKGKLIDACVHAVHKETGYYPELSTTGGTSDGRFIAPYGVEVVELGPINATIHQVNECVNAEDLDSLSRIYLKICEILLLQST